MAFVRHGRIGDEGAWRRDTGSPAGRPVKRSFPTVGWTFLSVGPETLPRRRPSRWFFGFQLQAAGKYPGS